MFWLVVVVVGFLGFFLIVKKSHNMSSCVTIMEADVNGSKRIQTVQYSILVQWFFSWQNLISHSNIHTDRQRGRIESGSRTDKTNRHVHRQIYKLRQKDQERQEGHNTYTGQRKVGRQNVHVGMKNIYMRLSNTIVYRLTVWCAYHDNFIFQ